MPYKDRDKHLEYLRQYHKGWYQRNKVKRLAQKHERKMRMYELYQQIKSELRCSQCGESHPATLHFHHRNPKEKEFNIADFVKRGGSVEALYKEMEKCVVLCANCHAKLHYEQNKKAAEDKGIAGQLAEFKALITPTADEEAAYAAVFGESGDIDEEYRAYQSYYGVDPKNRE